MSHINFCLTPYGKDLAGRHYPTALRAARSIARKFRIDEDEIISLMGPVYLWVIARVSTSRGITDRLFIYRRVCYDLMGSLRYSSEAYHHRERKNRVNIDLKQVEGDRGQEQAESATNFDMITRMAGDDGAAILRWRLQDNEEFAEIGRRIGITYHGAKWRFNRAIGLIRMSLGVDPPPRELRRDPYPPAPDSLTRHPEWPDYGLDAEGEVWSLRGERPRLMTQHKHGDGGGYRQLKLRRNGVHKIYYSQFVSTHPLRDVVREKHEKKSA